MSKHLGNDVIQIDDDREKSGLAITTTMSCSRDRWVDFGAREGCTERLTNGLKCPDRKVDYQDRNYIAGKDAMDILTNPTIYKGRAFTLKERQLLGIHGLLPPSILTQDQQVFQVMQNFYRCDNDLDRYIYLMGLQDRNEKLFYRVIDENIELMMPVIYTPTVGLACQKYGLIFRKPRGLFISIHDKGHIYDMLCNWPESVVKAIVVTDGERILGLGDLGSYGMGIPVGKLALYTACAGVRPYQCLPITLDVGTNNEALLTDPLYIGLRQKRVQGEKYDEFIEEFMIATTRRFGQSVLIQFEDFANHNAFRLLEKYRDLYCTFNDDIQGTAAVAVAGLTASKGITGIGLSQGVYLFQGAGEAACGIAKLLAKAIVAEGLSMEEATSKIWMVDSKGLLVKDRPEGGITKEKEPWANKKHKPMPGSFGDIVKAIKPTAIIGVAAMHGSFTEEVIRSMSEFNKRPVIFALSNPTSKAECTAEQAYTHSKGKCVFASGSPFNPVQYEGKTYHPGQGNNAYIFPGIGLGVVACGIRHISDDIFLISAQALASMVTQAHLDEGRVYIPLTQVREASLLIAKKICEHAYAHQNASVYPEPENKEALIRECQYTTEYESFIPKLYDWPVPNANY